MDIKYVTRNDASLFSHLMIFIVYMHILVIKGISSRGCEGSYKNPIHPAFG